MSYIQTNDSRFGEPVSLFYQDWGQGKPVVLIHGWPLSHEMWEYQMTELPKQGIRCIAYDRRGFGKSSKPWGGYDYDTLADDLKAVLDELDLQDVTLVGFSMGGGEVARYFSRHGGARVSKAVLVSAVTPFMLQTDDNPDGVPQETFDEMLTNMKEDRIKFLDDFGKQFFGVNLINRPVSTPLLDYYRMLASFASPVATQECAKAFSSTDFRQDMGTINVPTLIIHGDADKTVPIEASGEQSSQMVLNSTYKVYDGAPHGLFYTEKEQLNSDLIDFILEPVAARSATTSQMY
ncbi:alpha/beta fold hydrolase [Arsenicibacter rosenii]|uniref:Alpha/beta hydrolase n=1 Tax=Arsenicibacter rosenii TaxID=1750698 RepID=A0A1S2VMM6_9BACT|nr:alpha/beta hydrolase [Arsenicibacter rosenii]OIN59446.1 alpha/beta hydrolase [Arsenicibacter rosenii]